MTTIEKVAVDTNVLLYLIEKAYPGKQDKSIQIIKEGPVFCSQALSEYINVCFKRFKKTKQEIIELVTELMNNCHLIPIEKRTVSKSFDLINQYDFQLFDSLIVASALEAGCSILYSEDMHHGLIVENQLTIINPFL